MADPILRFGRGGSLISGTTLRMSLWESGYFGRWTLYHFKYKTSIWKLHAVLRNDETTTTATTNRWDSHYHHLCIKLRLYLESGTHFFTLKRWPKMTHWATTSEFRNANLACLISSTFPDLKACRQAISLSLFTSSHSTQPNRSILSSVKRSSNTFCNGPWLS